jgi:hypothetical protein
MTIPVSLLDDLASYQRDNPDGRSPRVFLLMRHSVRFPILTPADTYVVGLTEEGVRLAEELGGRLGKHFLPGRLRSAPVGRCRATAQAIARGAGWTGKVRADRRLSHPHIEPAWELVAQKMVNGVLPAQVQETLRWITGAPELAFLEEHPRLDVLVTHDTVLGAVVGSLLHAPVLGPAWPGYLEGLLLWREEDEIHARWRGIEDVFSESFQRIQREVPEV